MPAGRPVRRRPWPAVAGGAVYLSLLGAFVLRFLDPPEDEVWTRKGWVLILALLALLNVGLGFAFGRRTALLLASFPLVLMVIIGNDSLGAAGVFAAALAGSAAFIVLGGYLRTLLPGATRNLVAGACCTVLTVLASFVAATADPTVVEVRVLSDNEPFTGASAHLALRSGDPLDDEWTGHDGLYSLQTGAPRADVDPQGLAHFLVRVDWSTYGACADARNVEARLDAGGWWRDRWRGTNGEPLRVAFDLGPCLSRFEELFGG